jgi:hypothetical protein
LELAAGEMSLSVPDQPVLDGKPASKLGLKTIKLTAKLPKLICDCTELPSCLLNLPNDLVQLGLSLPTRTLNFSL